MSEDWLRGFKGSPGLKELRVEYETLSWKKDEMMKIVERNKKWKLAILDEEGHLSAEGTKLAEWKWKGPSKLDGQDWAHHGPGDTVEYVVVTDTWRYVGSPLSEEDAARRLGEANRDSQPSFSDDEVWEEEVWEEESPDPSEYEEDDNENREEFDAFGYNQLDREQSERGLESEGV